MILMEGHAQDLEILLAPPDTCVHSNWQLKSAQNAPNKAPLDVIRQWIDQLKLADPSINTVAAVRAMANGEMA